MTIISTDDPGFARAGRNPPDHLTEADLEKIGEAAAARRAGTCAARYGPCRLPLPAPGDPQAACAACAAALEHLIGPPRTAFSNRAAMLLARYDDPGTSPLPFDSQDEQWITAAAYLLRQAARRLTERNT